MRRLGTLLLAASLALAACTDDDDREAPSVPRATFEIRIANDTFSPLDLQVPPGATVTVYNDDDQMHTVTSQDAPFDFTPGDVGDVFFDTGPFVGQRSFTISDDAEEGTVIPYYCAVHLGAMATPNGTITINSNAPGNDAGGNDGGIPSGGLDGGVAPPQQDAGPEYGPPR